MNLNKIVIVWMVCVLYGFATEDRTWEIKEAGMKIDLPEDLWFLAEKKNDHDRQAYFFKRASIDDHEGRKIIPNIGIIIEKAPADGDAIAYSAMKRTYIPFDVSEVFTGADSKKINYKNAIGYQGTYNDRLGTAHTIYVIHAIHNDKALQFIMDCTTSVFKEINPEFQAAIKSIRAGV